MYHRIVSRYAGIDFFLPCVRFFGFPVTLFCSLFWQHRRRKLYTHEIRRKAASTAMIIFSSKSLEQSKEDKYFFNVEQECIHLKQENTYLWLSGKHFLFMIMSKTQFLKSQFGEVHNPWREIYGPYITYILAGMQTVRDMYLWRNIFAVCNGV